LPVTVIRSGRRNNVRAALIEPKQIDWPAIAEHLRKNAVERHLGKIPCQRRKAGARHRYQSKNGEVLVSLRIQREIDRRQRKAVGEQTGQFIFRNHAETNVCLRREEHLREAVGADARQRKTPGRGQRLKEAGRGEFCGQILPDESTHGLLQLTVVLQQKCLLNCGIREAETHARKGRSGLAPDEPGIDPLDRSTRHADHR
jgi:hypothetical protein